MWLTPSPTPCSSSARKPVQHDPLRISACRQALSLGRVDHRYSVCGVDGGALCLEHFRMTDNGASPSGDRAFVPTASSPQAVSPVPASIPSAEGLGHWRNPTDAQLRRARIRLSQAELTASLDELLPLVRRALRHGIDPIGPGSITSALGYAYERASGVLASAIEARRAETGTGSVHESAVPKADAQGDGA